MGTRVENFKNWVKCAGGKKTKIQEQKEKVRFRLKSLKRYGAVYGGSEEIMASLGLKIMLKNIPATAKL